MTARAASASTQQRQRHLSDLPALAQTAAMLRASGLVLLAGIAAIHVAQIVGTYQQSVPLGSAFVVLIVASIVAAGLLVRRGSATDWIVVGAVSAAALAGYALTRLWSTPLDTQDVGNWSEALGMVALLVEGGLLVLSGYAARLLRSTGS